VDPVHDLLELSARREDRANASFEQRVEVTLRNDATAEHQDVVRATRLERIEHRREKRIVCAGHDRQADRIHVLLKGCDGDHVGGLMEPGVDHLEACIPQRASDHLGPAVVAVEAWLCDEDADLWAVHPRFLVQTRAQCQQPGWSGCYPCSMLWPLSVRGLRRDVPDVRPEVEAWCRAEGIARPSDVLIADFYVPMAAWVAEHVDERTLVLGLNGAQGTGKSTLARLLKVLLERLYGLRVAIVSLDDLYLTAAERARRAESIHPLLATRGVPGTHDVDLGVRTIRALREGKPLALPRFDKARDDRAPVSSWPRWEGRCDVLIFEGWCVGARAQRPHELEHAVNGFERLEDSSGDWRWYVNRELGGAYQTLFAEIDLLVTMLPPDFARVVEWREAQEARLRECSQGSETMTPTAVKRFIKHFERLTRFMWDEMPGRADAVIRLGDDHSPVEVDLGDG